MQHLVEVVATGAFRSSPAIGQRQAIAESELARLEAGQAQAAGQVNMSEVIALVTTHFRSVVNRIARLDWVKDVERPQMECARSSPQQIGVEPRKDGWIEAERQIDGTPSRLAPEG